MELEEFSVTSSANFPGSQRAVSRAIGAIGIAIGERCSIRRVDERGKLPLFHDDHPQVQIAQMIALAD